MANLGTPVEGTKLQFGTLHPELQQFDAFEVDGSTTLTTTKVDPADIGTWAQQWPSSSKAFYTPRLMAGEQLECPFLTYGDLCRQIEQCPTWRSPHAHSGESSPFVVGVVLPLDWMTELAVVHLCIVSGRKGGDNPPTCSAPLDPRTSRRGLLEALHQLQCRGLVLSQDLLESFKLHFLVDCGRDDGSSESEDKNREIELEKQISNRITDVRVVASAPNGGITWKICKSGKQSEVPVAPNESKDSYDDSKCDGQDHPVLILRTSGTTSTPKLVPLQARQLYLNAKAQQRAMSLTHEDSTINSMPLFHIGGLSCSFFSVLVSGGSVIYSGKFEPSRFLEQLCGGRLGHSPGGGDAVAGTATMLSPGCLPEPTWFNAVPTMHKALLLSISTLESEVQNRINICRVTPLRFIRSGAAQLGQDVVDGLKESLPPTRAIINSYAMSECMPICVEPLGQEGNRSSPESAEFGPTVGVPVFPSLRISDPSTGQALKYNGGDGEICIKGPSVIKSYLNVAVSESHTSDGWLRTGDVGRMDPNSGSITITGRVKELIKVGGEQVWPVQVDNCIVNAVDEVEIAITFGVPNELWGEEVAVAIVLRDGTNKASTDKSHIEYRVKEACRMDLDEIAVPSQVLFISTDEIPCGTSGKYLRTQMAKHLGVQSVNNGTLLVFEGLKKQKQIRELRADVQPTSSGEEIEAQEEDAAPIPMKVQTHSSIDGARIIASCFVVMAHVGIYPNVGWEIIRGFNLSVPFFFVLAGFQLSLSVVGKIQWTAFVGIRIGHLQSLFLISQLLALPGFLLMRCGGGEMAAVTCDQNFYTKQILMWLFATLTGMFGVHNYSNFPSWFLTVIYQFIIIFPFLDRGTRSLRRAVQMSLFVPFTGLATVLSVIFFFVPGGVFSSLRRTILVFFPTLFSSMIMAYFFIRGSQQGHGRAEKARLPWGFITDAMSLSFVIILVLAVTLNQCIWLPASTTATMRPGVPLESYDSRPNGFGALTSDPLYCVPHVTYSEFLEYLHDNPETPTSGRYPSMIVNFISILRMGTPLVMIWAYGLAKGFGWTAKLLQWRPLVKLSPLTYHLYLLHVPIARYYWLVTRPSTYKDPPFWFGEEGMYPFPVQWWEVLIIISLCLFVALGIERFITPYLQTHTVRLGLFTCEKIAITASALLRVLSCGRYQGGSDKNNEDAISHDNVSTQIILEEKISALTGAVVTASSELDSLGLDSLGATALLTTIRSATPKASRLTVYDLYGLKTVGDLVTFIDNGCRPLETDEEQG